jgi:DNA-binding transcriptional regulator of glucitol operon
MSEKTGRGHFTANPFKYTTSDGKVLEWAGRGRFSKDIVRLVEAGDEGLIAALAAHKKPTVTGNPVGRPPSKAIAQDDIKAMAAETVAKAVDIEA